MALIEKIQQSLATTGSEPVGNTDQTGRARQLLAAKSGKQISTSQLAPQSAVAEAAAVDQTRQQMAALQPAAQLASAQLGQQAQQVSAAETGARADLALRQQQMQQQNSLKKQQLLSEAAREGRKLDFDRDAAKLEQIAHTMRLSDKQYMDKLEMEGQKRRLDNSLAFKEELQRSIFGSNTDLLKTGLGNKSVLEASDRDFAEMMNQMDITAALEFAENEQKDARQAAIIGAAGSLATAGVGAYEDQQEGKFDEDYQAYRDSGGTKSYSGYKSMNSAPKMTPVSNTNQYNEG